MNEYLANKAIAQQWVNNWPTASGNVPYALDNNVVDQTSSYARLKLVGGLSEQYSLGGRGNRRVLREGNVQVLIAVLVNQGTKARDLAVMAARQVLELQTLGASDDPLLLGVTTQAASLGKQWTEGQFWNSVLIVPFTFYDTV